MPSKALRLAALVLSAVCGAMAKATVNSTDGGYENLLVAIEENVPYHPDIVNNIMVLFRKASQFLLVATRGKFYFKDVMILTPNTWPSSSDAETMWEDPYKDAEVQISDSFTLPGILEPVPLRAVSPNPVQLPTKYITDLNGATTTQYKKPEYHLIHYWATHRYGVLSEGSSSSPGGIDFYCSAYGTAPTRCSDLIKFEWTPKAGGKCPDVQPCVNLTSTACDVTFKQPQNRMHWARGSIMFLPYVEGVFEFCEQDTHNYEATSLHNTHKQISTWDVILQHEDSKKTDTFPINRTVFSTFRLFQRSDEKSQRVVLVLDVSYSMRRRDGDDRLTFLQCAMNHMVRHMLHDYQALGIVTFSGRCQVAHPLVVLNTTDARDGITRVIDGLVMGSGTSIGCGLAKATEMLEGNGTSARGGLVFLVTDGEENYKPWIVEQLPILVSSGVKVSTFALGSLAEKKLEDVALQTGGSAYAFGNLKVNPIAGLTVSFLLSTTATMPKEEQYVVLLDETAAVSGRKEFPFTIAKELGHETKILVTTPNDEDYNLEVEDSKGKVCAACNVTLGKQSTNIDMPRTSTTASWKLVVKPKAASTADITVVVLSKQRVPGQDPIRAQSSVEHNNQQTRIYSKVTKGTAAVLGALVTATVTFGGPGGTGETLQLLDNGIGADNLKDDGDYSAFFTQLKGAGRYSVRTDVKVTKNTRLGPYKGAKPQPAKPSTPSGRSGPPGPSRGSGTSESSGYLVTSASGPSTPSGPPGPSGGPGTSGSSGSPVTSASGTSPPNRFVTKLFNPGHDVACGPSAECKKRKGHHVASNSRHASHARQMEERVNEELSLVAYAGSVQVKSDLMREDLSPAPIRDLVVSDATLNDEAMTATLSWTSMGAYLDSGQAQAVDIRAASHPRVLLFTFNNATPISQEDVLEGSLEPLEPYEPQKVKIKLPEELVSRAQGRPNSIYLGMRTLNDKGRASSVSNIVPVTNIASSKPAPPTVRRPDVTRKLKPHPPVGKTTVPPPGQKTSDETPDTVSMSEKKKTSYIPLLLGLLGALLVAIPSWP